MLRICTAACTAQWLSLARRVALQECTTTHGMRAAGGSLAVAQQHTASRTTPTPAHVLHRRRIQTSAAVLASHDDSNNSGSAVSDASDAAPPKEVPEAEDAAAPAAHTGTHQDMPRQSTLDSIAANAAQVPGDATAETLARSADAVDAAGVNLRQMDSRSRPIPAAPTSRRSRQRRAPLDDSDGLMFNPNGPDEPDASYLGVDLPPVDTSVKPHLVEKYLSEEHQDAAGRWKRRKASLIRELQRFEHDTGTLPVQIGLLTERIAYLTRHTQEHKKDRDSRRGLIVLLSRRRKQLAYLRRADFAAYVKVLRRFDLKDKVSMGRGERHPVGSNLKWTPDQPESAALPPAEELVAQARADMVASLQRKPKVRLDGKTLGPKELQTHEFNLRLIDRRAARIEAQWRERLQQSAQHLPPELSESQRAAADAQMAPKTIPEIIKDKREARRERRQRMLQPTRHRTSHVALPL